VESHDLRVSAHVGDAFDVAEVLGQSHAFGAVAGRCSAARAEGLRRLRDQKKYLRLSPNWRSFCARYLNMSRAQADRIIALWEEFGASYFEIAELTRISPETYRLIEPEIRGGALHVDGETIELCPANAHRVTAAVSKLRCAKPSIKPVPEIRLSGRLKALENGCARLICEFRLMAKSSFVREERTQFQYLLRKVSGALQQIERQIDSPADTEE